MHAYSLHYCTLVQSTDDFSCVMDQLGVHISRQDLHRLEQLFDRYGDHAMDYTAFCNRVLFDHADMEQLSHKIANKFSSLR
jgi:hypothetical protein